MNSRNLFWRVLESGSPRSMCHVVPVLVRVCFWVTDSHVLYPHVLSRRMRVLCAASFMRALISFTRAPPSWPSHLLKTSPSNTTKFGGLGFQHMKFRGTEPPLFIWPLLFPNYTGSLVLFLPSIYGRLISKLLLIGFHFLFPQWQCYMKITHKIHHSAPKSCAFLIGGSEEKKLCS